MKIVLANGCFDVLHIGHLWHLAEACQQGDRLIVSLTLDEYVNKGPGLPINSWCDRAMMLRSLRMVDEVIPTACCWDAIRLVRPQVFVKGIDYATSSLLDPARVACAEVGAQLYITQSRKLSSGDIIRRMREVVLT